LGGDEYEAMPGLEERKARAIHHPTRSKR